LVASGTTLSLVFFDLGGVTARFLPERRLPALASLGAAPAAQLHEAIWGSGLSRQFDAGRYSAGAMRAKLCELLRARPSEESLASAWCLAFEPVPEVLAVARELRSKVRVGLLSNNPPILLEALPRELPQLASAFSPILFSCALGALKPDLALFELVARQVGVAPNNLLLIDDSPANVAGARRAGWQAISFQSTAGLRRELSALGLADRSG
jgi:glucose-1-phosphatase